MKLPFFLILLTLLLVFVPGCKKEDAPLPEAQKLARERINIVKDWKVSKLMIVKPSSLYAVTARMNCQDSLTFSFRSDGQFRYSDPCNQQQSAGFWDLPKADSLFINFTGPVFFSAYEKLEITQLTADTMKWNILASYNNDIITMEYAFIPK
jgi:hypothetical protein